MACDSFLLEKSEISKMKYSTVKQKSLPLHLYQALTQKLTNCKTNDVNLTGEQSSPI